MHFNTPKLCDERTTRQCIRGFDPAQIQLLFPFPATSGKAPRVPKKARFPACSLKVCHRLKPLREFRVRKCFCGCKDRPVKGFWLSHTLIPDGMKGAEKAQS